VSETCRVIINQVKQKLHLVGYLLIRYFKDARYHEHKILVILAKHWLWLPDDVGAASIILICFNNSTFFTLCALVG